LSHHVAEELNQLISFLKTLFDYQGALFYDFNESLRGISLKDLEAAACTTLVPISTTWRKPLGKGRILSASAFCSTN
jgi:hypothetical protein